MRLTTKIMLALAAVLAPASALAQPATLALTFDYWNSAYVDAMPILSAKNLQATWYVAPSTIGLTDLPSMAELTVLQQIGWEIGIYSNQNMVTALATDRVTAKQWMANQKSQLLALGIEAKSYAPNSRQWSTGLANLSRDLFDNVRAANGSTDFQTYPVPDPANVQNGISDSLSQSDTGASLCAYVDQIVAAPGKLAIMVVHKVGDVPDAYTVKRSDFSQFVDCVAAARDAGTLRVTTFSRAIVAPQ